VNISGNLTRDPELRATSTGTQVLTFGVAVNDRRRNPQTGEWEDVPNFVDCVVFGNRAKSLGKILKKGMPVTIKELGIENPDIDLLGKKLHENKGEVIGGYYRLTATETEQIYRLAL
jgi:hypothetical protein